MYLFNVDAKIFLEKLKKKICPQKVGKKHLEKLLTYGSWKFFLCSPACPKQPRSSFLFYKFSYTFICAKICDWNELENFVCFIAQKDYKISDHKAALIEGWIFIFGHKSHC